MLSCGGRAVLCYPFFTSSFPDGVSSPSSNFVTAPSEGVFLSWHPGDGNDFLHLRY